MTPRKLGRLAEVDLDSICLYENNDFSDFSRWLVDNPDLLGDALGLRLKIVQTQLAFGNLRQSILAEEAQGGKVAIEGYLDRANRTDQGRLLTYAAGCDAKYVVWVALRFTTEDRVTIDWLNRLGPDKVWFYGVEIRAVRIDDSLPAPYFRVVAAPKALHQGFFQPRIDDPGQECFAEDPKITKRKTRSGTTTPGSTTSCMGPVLWALVRTCGVTAEVLVLGTSATRYSVILSLEKP